MKKSGSCRVVGLVMAHWLRVFVVGGAVMSRTLLSACLFDCRSVDLRLGRG